MRNITDILPLSLITLLLVASGCSHQSDSVTLQGTWTGQEGVVKAPTPVRFIISGNLMEYRGYNTNEWFKGTFTLHEDKNPKQLIGLIATCSLPDYIGKTVNTIYKFESNTLTIVAAKPGSADIPTNFTNHNTRRFVVTKQ